jgi:hypothetical protein
MTKLSQFFAGLWDYLALPLLVGLVVLILLVMTGCQTVDKALLEPDTRNGEPVYVQIETGDTVKKSEIPPGQEDQYEPVYVGPKDFSEEPWGTIEYGGVSLGGIAAIAASAWWFIRRRRKPQKSSSAEPEVSSR